MNSKMSVVYHLADHVFWQSQFCKILRMNILEGGKGQERFCTTLLI